MTQANKYLCWDLKFVVCPTHENHKIKCPANKNDITLHFNFFYKQTDNFYILSPAYESRFDHCKSIKHTNCFLCYLLLLMHIKSENVAVATGYLF